MINMLLTYPNGSRVTLGNGVRRVLTCLVGGWLNLACKVERKLYCVHMWGALALWEGCRTLAM